jgi:hypothetical protein
MVYLPSVPSLGTMMITRDGVWKESYPAPRGSAFSDEQGRVVVTDRAGAVLTTFYADTSEKSIDWLAYPEDLTDIPNGANFEMFIDNDDGPFKVRYGRVVRREPSFPLSPSSSTAFDAVMYEDLLQRDQAGPYWIPKSGKVGMFPDTSPRPAFSMAVRNNNIFLPLPLFSNAAVLWYAPVRSDTVEVAFSLTNPGAGKTTIVVCSNYAMNSYLGVQFDTNPSTDVVQMVTGTGPITTVNQGSSVNHTIPTNGGTYTVKYSLPLNKLSLYVGSSLSPLIEFTDSSHLATHGLGYRYVGVSWQASLLNSGPRLFYYKAMDDV